MAIPSQTPERNPRQSPLRISPSQWREVLKRTAGEVKADRVSLIAAGVAFYWFLAIFPGLIAAVGILDLVDASALAINSIEASVRSALPGDAAEVILDALADASDPREGASLVAAIIGIAGALWSASAGMVALQTGLNVSYDVETDRKFVAQRGYALALIAATGVLGGLAGTMLGSGKSVTAWLVERGYATPLVMASKVSRWVLALVAMTVLLAVFYYWGPNRRSPHWKWITPGGVLATVGWVVVSLAFGLYLNRFGSYAETYGSLAGVVILVLSLYLAALAILVGAELNSELERQAEARARKKTPSKASPSRRLRQKASAT